MCEWLSRGEWCDVRLLCGGSVFSAHRAVLASVSSFLRKLLLSCPTDESPTFIVLPEFDLDAMSSVLYYIYNGEVIIRKEKITEFLDIVKAMQIFIDSRYLPEITEKINVKLKEDSKIILSKRNIFTLGFSEKYVLLKKRNDIQNALQQHQNLNFNDKIERNQNNDRETETPLVDPKSSCRNRQKGSFLRDLFIEAYPRNSNGNGLETGVLAMSSECYRAPTSVLLTNANVEHLDTDKIHSRAHARTSEHTTCSPTDFVTSNSQGYSLFSFCKNSTLSLEHDKCSKYLYDADSQVKQESVKLWMDKISSLRNSSDAYNLMQQSIVSNIFQPTEHHCFINRKESTNCVRNIDTSTSSKATILNHVLDNPWSPRVNTVFKPFHKKPEKLTRYQQSNKQDNEETVHNDTNNNIDKPIKLEAEEATFSEDKDLSNILKFQSIDTEFNCNICNQVFLSDTSYAVHMRRHSTVPRYTCGECGKTFSQLRNFKYHMSIHRGTREFAATCSVCGKYFNDRGYLSSHMKIHRNRKEYKCALCPKSFNQRVAYNMHMRIHTGVKPHVCSECGKAFSRKMLLKQHQRTHSGERPYACTHCDKRFADRSNMTLHLRLHTGVKPFSCTLCPKSFTKKHHLKSHLNFHTGSKPYSCPRCKLAFTQSSNMRTHMKKCHVTEPEGDTQHN